MRTTIYTLLGLFLLACSNGQTANKEGNLIATTAQLPDSLFPFHNIKNSLVTEKFYYDRETFFLYTDSTKKRAIVHLDSLQKLKFIAPVMVVEFKTQFKDNPNLDTNYVVNFMNAFFISKQNKVYDFTPVIASVSGDDYGALFYIILDESFRPISHYRISGGFCAGPWDGPDSTIQMCPDRQSFLNDTEISSYELNEFIRPDSLKRPSIIDSITYLTKILPSGQIETKRLDSIRYERMAKL